MFLRLQIYKTGLLIIIGLWYTLISDTSLFTYFLLDILNNAVSTYEATSQTKASILIVTF